MKANRIKDAINLADKAGFVFIATAGNDSIPHIAAAGIMKLADEDGCVLLREWFCPGTVKNLKANPAMSIVIWDKDSDIGYQLLGHLKSVKDVGILDGYGTGLEKKVHCRRWKNNSWFMLKVTWILS